MYGYKLEQSTDQEGGVALASLMNGGDSVEFDHCSMFIDCAYVLCIDYGCPTVKKRDYCPTYF